MTELIEYQKLANYIIVNIDNKNLENDIIKYIAPKLFWNKNSILEIDKYDKVKEIKCDKLEDDSIII